jgi:16S rRNA (cytosine1407-C5)-methyltransferase
MILSQNISDYILKNFGREYLENYLTYIQSSSNTYIRLSPFFNSDETIQSLKNYGVQLKQVENIHFAYQVIEGSHLIGKTLDFILGKYYIQSLSSMIPAMILNPSSNDKTIDLCAAPGSKTTQLAEMMNNKGTLIANEISPERVKSLVFNVDKMNLVNFGIIQGKGELLNQIYDNYFDKILVDAPCSALGILQKKNEVSNWWNENRLNSFTELQTRLLVSAIKMCKVGGEIVYSTCTLSIEENELVLNKILKKYPVEIIEIKLPIKSHNAFTQYENEKLDSSIQKAKRIIPWEINSEGFFICKLRKIEKTEKSEIKRLNKDNIQLVDPKSSKIKDKLKILSEYFGIDEVILSKYKYLIKTNDIYFVEKNFESPSLSNFMRIGSKLGSIEKRGYIQLHSLAAQIFRNSITNNIIELDIEQLKIYLKGGTIKKDFSTTGQKVIKFRNDIIGTAVASKDGLKSQFPREYRTQEIIVK